MLCFLLGGLMVFTLLRFGPFRPCYWGRFRRGPFGRVRRWHHTDWDPDDDPGLGDRRGRPYFLRYLSDRLDATPAQERTMAAAFEEFRAEAKGLREEVSSSRKDVAAALRKPSFDEVLLGELYARHDTAIEKLRKAFVGMMAKVHDALEEPQRERLAQIIERGPEGFFHVGHFGRGFDW
jgi:Heavy-metal resistance